MMYITLFCLVLDTSRPLEKATALSKKSPRSKAAVGGVFGDSDSGKIGLSGRAQAAGWEDIHL